MRTWCLVLACFGILGATMAASAGEIVISANVQSAIQAEASRSLKQFTLDKGQMEHTRTLMRTWVSGSMDLSAASKRVSQRFNRTSYMQRSDTDKVRLPAERLQRTTSEATGVGRNVKRLATARLDPRAVKTLKVSTPVQMVFRDGASHLKFQKVKETRAKAALTEAEATQLARGFLDGNLLLKQTEMDKVGRVYVRERRINEQRGEGQAPDDYLVQQDVIFERHVEGRPVINSKIAVGFQPDSKDILLLEHFNWTPLQQQEGAEGSEAMTPRFQPVAAPAAAQLRARVEAKIQETSGQNFTKAEAVKAVPAWFQTEDSLLPVLVVEVKVTVPGRGGQISESYLEVLNLAGSDDVFFPGRTAPEAPTAAR